MATRTKTTVAEPEYVDLDGDGDVDAIVTSKRTVTKTIVEEQDIVLLPEEQETPVVPDPRAVLPPGECGDNPCLQRTAVTFTTSKDGLTVTATPAWKGNIAWDFGGTVVVGRGPVEFTFASAGAKTITASPLHSACLKASTPVVVTV